MRYKDENISSSGFIAKPGQKTFEHDEELPSLPLPELDQTLNTYLESARPFLSSAEFRKTERIVENFRNGSGKELQNLLKLKAESKRNWLDDWWYRYAYLKLRFPIAPYMNLGGPAPYVYNVWPPAFGTQIKRSALTMYYGLQHWLLVRREQLAPDTGAKGKEPWSMNQFRRLYSSCRTPGLEEDTLHEYFRIESEGETPTHVVVLLNKRLYIVEMLNSRGELFTPPQIQRTLESIQADATEKGEGIGLATLTSEARPTWYHLRNHLLSLSKLNGKNLDLIQSAIFTLGFSAACPQTMTQSCQQALLGPPGNIWYDKSFNNVSYANGMFANNCDHAPMDAMTMVNCTYFIDCKLLECNGSWQGDMSVAAWPSFQELEFQIDEKISSAIPIAEKNYLLAADSIELINCFFGYYGKSFLRSLKLHPDTFVQVCLQYAYYKLHNKPAPTYETATTRKYYRGRTETVRSCTNESLQFSKAMLDPQMSNVHRMKLFKQAMDVHHSQMKVCMAGQGIDRHLLGLKIIAEENGFPVPELFTDPAYERSGGNGNFTLSTSFVGFSSIHGGVAPMCENGYGFFYRMSAERMVFFITAWKSDEATSSTKLYDTMSEVLLQMRGLLLTTPFSAL